MGAGALFALVFAVLFAPVLAGRATFVHGDALSVSLPLQTLLASALAEGRIPLWSDAIYGGHPIFAEGQGGFLHPLNLLLFWTLPRLLDGPGPSIGAGTLYAHGLLHWICAWIAAFGTFGLCRTLGLGVPAALFGGFALAASQDWLGLTGNSAIALAVSFAPLTLWAVERWWRTPTVGTALALGSAVTAMVLAGYPQAVHAVVIGAAVMLLVRADRDFWSAPGAHFATGLLAIATAVGLSAVQLLPTIELVGESVRAGGVDLVESGAPARQLRGMLFGLGRIASAEPGLGSLLVLGVAGLGIRFSRLPLGWLLATLVLFQLALADGSPVYAALRGVLPGLDSFRITHLYATVGLVGVAVLAGFGVQRLADGVGVAPDAGRPLLLRIGCVAIVSIGAAVALQNEEVGAVAYVLPAMGLLLMTVGVALGRTRWIPAVLVLLLVVEVIALRPRHNLVDVADIREPTPTAAYLIEQPDRHVYRVANVPHFFSYIGFAPPRAENLSQLAGLYLSSLDAGSNLLWDVPSVNANLALPLARREAVDELIEREIRGESGRPPGTRFIDAEGVRWVVARERNKPMPYAADLQRVFFDAPKRFFVLENASARERLQLVSQKGPRWVLDAEEAIDTFAEDGDAKVILEGARRQPEGGTPTGGGAFEIVSAQASSEHYAVRVESPEPAYLVLADAPYPGWVAHVDGEPAPIIPANVLGKAVAVPPGRHLVQLDFVPDSFRLGAWISAATLAAVVAAIGWPAWTSRRSSR